MAPFSNLKVLDFPPILPEVTVANYLVILVRPSKKLFMKDEETVLLHMVRLSTT